MKEEARCQESILTCELLVVEAVRLVFLLGDLGIAPGIESLKNLD